MYSLRQTMPNKEKAKGFRGKSSSTKFNFNMGYIIIILGVVVFFARSISVINKYNERSGYAYVQLLNYGMPLVKTQAYDETNYSENKISLKKVALEALGLSNINATDIIGNQIALFSDSSLVGNDIGKHLPVLKPFKLNDTSITKMTSDEIAELNKVSPAYDPSLKRTLDNSKTRVLIFHTHTTENYVESASDTTESDCNVVGVGEVLAKELEEGYGISVIHDKTNHSVSYNESYTRSNETLKKYLNEYGDFDLIIDLHRDGVDEAKAATLKNSYTINLNDQNLAKMMFVIGENSATYESNKALTDELSGIANKLFPGLMKPTYVYEIAATSINQGLSKNSLLIEFGSNVNASQEARLSAKYMARILAEHLNR